MCEHCAYCHQPVGNFGVHSTGNRLWFCGGLCHDAYEVIATPRLSAEEIDLRLKHVKEKNHGIGTLPNLSRTDKP